MDQSHLMLRFSFIVFSSGHPSSQDIDVEKLKEIFPNWLNNQITEAMEGCKTIDGCISSILDTKGEFVVSLLYLYRNLLKSKKLDTCDTDI